MKLYCKIKNKLEFDFDNKKIEEDFRIIGNTPKITLLIYHKNTMLQIL